MASASGTYKRDDHHRHDRDHEDREAHVGQAESSTPLQQSQRRRHGPNVPRVRPKAADFSVPGEKGVYTDGEG